MSEQIKFNSEHRDYSKEDEYLRLSRKVGEAYISFINQLSGGSNFEEKSVDEFPEDIKKMLRIYLQSTEKYKEKYEKRVVEGKLVALDFLKQAFPQDVIERIPENGYQLKRLSTGIYTIVMTDTAYQILFPNENGRTQAKTAKIRDSESVSFIIIKDTTNQSYLSENIPHEINHLIGLFAQLDGHTFTDEKNEHIAKGFSLYREELLARLSSNGIIGGYDHIRINPTEREKLQKDEPESLKKLDEYNVILFDLCMELIYLVGTDELEVNKKDIILSVLQSKNFDELISKLTLIKKLAERKKIKIKSKDWTT
ncbi:MAG: hypothetical protein WC070_02900 [Candidatus Magasanikbacteria bacterium]